MIQFLHVIEFKSSSSVTISLSSVSCRVTIHKPVSFHGILNWFRVSVFKIFYYFSLCCKINYWVNNGNTVCSLFYCMHVFVYTHFFNFYSFHIFKIKSCLILVSHRFFLLRQYLRNFYRIISHFLK